MAGLDSYVSELNYDCAVDASQKLLYVYNAVLGGTQGIKVVTQLKNDGNRVHVQDKDFDWLSAMTRTSRVSVLNCASAVQQCINHCHTPLLHI